ncbi:MAG: hypothetical protein ACOY93_07785 [Bacillota bacterium]
MTQMTAAEVLFLQEHMRTGIAGVRFLNHCANETNDTQFKQLCQQFAQQKQRDLQQMLPLLQNATAGGPNVTGGAQQQIGGQVPRQFQ